MTMPQIHGRNWSLHIWDNSAASRNATPDLTSLSLSWSRNNPDATTFGKDSVQRISGLRDATLSGAFIYNTDTNGIRDVLEDLTSTSTVTLLKFISASGVAGCPMWTGCFLLSAYEESVPLDGPVAATFTFQLASGSLSASVV